MKITEFLTAKQPTTADGLPIPAWTGQWERGEVATQLQARRKIIAAGLVDEHDLAMADAVLAEGVNNRWLKEFQRHGERHYMRPDDDPRARPQDDPKPSKPAGSDAHYDAQIFIRPVRLAMLDENDQVIGGITLPLQFVAPQYDGPAGGYYAFRDHHAVPYDGWTAPERVHAGKPGLAH